DHRKRRGVFFNLIRGVKNGTCFGCKGRHISSLTNTSIISQKGERLPRHHFQGFYSVISDGYQVVASAPITYSSNFDALRAFSTMKSRRGSTTSPMRVENTCSASLDWWIFTCIRERMVGSSVVSHSCSGFISPRPL